MRQHSPYRRKAFFPVAFGPVEQAFDGDLYPVRPPRTR